MNDIFISYSTADRPFVEQLCTAFESRQWSVWWDRDIPHGSDFDEVIERELSAAKCVVVVWTPRSVQSRWVRAEAEDALARGVLIPILANDTKIPLAFRQIQAAPLIGWHGDPDDVRLTKIADSIAELVGAQAVPEASASQRWWQRARYWLRRARHWLWSSVLVTASLYFLFVQPPAGMVVIPAFTFQMGNPIAAARNDFETFDRKQRKVTATEAEFPQHSVHVDRFLIDRFEVTADEFRQFAAANAAVKLTAPGAANHPAVSVTWEQAQAYCLYLNKSLPTEAQWESAARGMDQRRFPWGNEAPTGRHANFCDQLCEAPWASRKHSDRFAQLAPVGAYAKGASAQGVHDLAGNASEWVMDWYDPQFYLKKEAKHPNPINDQSPDSETKVIRGGDWQSDAYELRGIHRHYAAQDSSSETTGFRCAASAQLSARLKLKLHDLGVLR